MINEFINASAGTGKTYTLLNNIFAYNNGVPAVDYKTAVENINKSVFLTFSNSATEEIKDRIFKGLLKCSNKPKMELCEEIIAQGINMKVYTIHSFALEMLKKFRYKLGLPAEMDFSDDEETIWNNCVEEFFYKHWNYDSLKEILKIQNNNKEQSALFELFWAITNKSSLKDFIARKGTTVFFLASLGKSSACNIELDETKQKIKDLFEKLEIDINTDCSKQLLKIREALIELETKDVTKEEEIKTYLNTFIPVTELLNMCSCFTEQILLYIGEQSYMPKMFVNGIFDFDAVIYLFIKELARDDINSFLQDLKDEDYNFENLYIDEAQDNDVIQNYFVILFGASNCPVKVTIVGDAKQSIYGWRNSYPKEFVEIGNECSKAITSNIKTTQLSVTRRILSKLTMDAINKLCSYAQSSFNWWYNKKDELLENDNIKTSKKLAQVEHWTGISLTQEYKNKLKDFLSTGNNAVLVRGRDYINKLKGLPEVLDEIKANYRLDLSIDGQKLEKIKTLKPELEFIKVLFGALSQDLASIVPFTMFWSVSGQYITKNILDKVKDKETFIEKFKAIFKRLYTDAQNKIYSNRIEAIFELFDNYNIWNCMAHKYSKQTDGLEVRRLFCHILTRAQLAENKKMQNINSTSFIDNAKSIIETAEITLSSYSIESEKEDNNTNSVDVITIHSSKGLTYDKVVVVANQKNNFFESHENLAAYPGYTNLFNIDFHNILQPNPDITISYFPYLYNTPAKILRTGVKLWSGSLDLYKKVKSLVVSENLNLLYVALTRAKTDIIFINLEKPKEEKVSKTKTKVKVEEETIDFFENFTKFNIKEEKEEKVQEIDNPTIVYLINENKFEQMDISKSVKTKSVRSEIKSKINKKYEKGVLNSLDRMEKVKIGSMLHNAVQNILPKTKTAKDFMNCVNDMKTNIEDTTSLQYEAIDILSKNNKVIEDNENILKENYTFSNEVPIWHFNSDGTLIKGSIDTLGFKKDEALIIEYKVLFDEKSSQKDLADSQMQQYEKMLECLKDTDITIKNKYMPFLSKK
ncbi:MAG: UvrD-helicase domain-containing protein [Endomicrobiaceae bacterium]|nr:UvrD-helicase domain-containing protein [Endomicrobiaceae bacterium]